MALAPIYRMVARDVALGIELEDISIGRDIPLGTLKKVASGNLFKKAVAKLSADIDAQVAIEAGTDPVRAKLHNASRRAADVLILEMESDAEDATASTRLRAADSILDRAGYKQQESTNNLAIIMLSPAKLDSVKNVDVEMLKNVPDMVDG